MNLSEQLIKIYEENYRGKFYLCFTYQGHDDVDTKHITHTYFGECSSEELAEIIEVVTAYFRGNPFTDFPVVMNKEEYFGPNKDIRVLRPADIPDDSTLWEPKLRSLLYKYNKSTFKDEPYKPHTTTEDEEVNGNVDGLAICSGNNVIKKWTKDGIE